MAASGNKFNEETKEDRIEIMPPELWNLPKEVVQTVVIPSAIEESWALLKQTLFFSGIHCAREQALFLAEHAGPLDDFERHTKQFIENELANTPPLFIKTVDDNTDIKAIIEQQNTQPVHKRSAILLKHKNGGVSIYGDPKHDGNWKLTPIHPCTPGLDVLLSLDNGNLNYHDNRLAPYVNIIKQGHAKAGYNALVDEIFTLGNRRGPLARCLASGSDFTKRNFIGTEIDEGMTERFIKIIKELLPHRFPDVLKQAQDATILQKDRYIAVLKTLVSEQSSEQKAYPENEEEIQEREKRNNRALKLLFDGFKKGDEEGIKKNIEFFKTFINCKQEGLIDNPNLVDLYYVNLLHLISGIENEQLPEGPCADRFYSEILDVLRDSINNAVMMQLLVVFITGDEQKIKEAIAKFKLFEKETEHFSKNEQGYFINNLFDRNCIYLIYKAYVVLAWRGDLLPGTRYGEIADQFLIEITGGLQRGLQPHMRQTLISTKGLLGLFEESKKVERQIDPYGERYLRRGDRQLGVNHCLDGLGQPCRSKLYQQLRGRHVLFLELLESIRLAPKFYTMAFYASQTVSMLGNVEAPSSPAVKR